MKKIIFVVLLLCCSNMLSAQNLLIPAFSEGDANNYFTGGNGDGGSLDTYNTFLNLHHGFAIGSPFVSNGQGGYVKKASIVMNGRNGDISTIGSLVGINGFFSSSVGIGTTNPSAYFPGKVLEIRDSRPILRLSPESQGGVGTILFKGAYNTNATTPDEFHLNYVSSTTQPRIVLGGYLNGGVTPALSVMGGGNVGIGNEFPKTTLDVMGTLAVGGVNIDSRYTEGNLNFLPNSRRMVIGWNRTAGGGETSFIANKSNGLEGGFSFYSYGDNHEEKQLMWIHGDGNVGIGTAHPTEKLAVKGKIRAQEIKVEGDGATWPDYVFKKDYELEPLSQIERYINKNQHLPEVPSASDIETNGVALGEMNKILLKKIEELTLHLIDKDKQIKSQEDRLSEIEKKLAKLLGKLN